ncbi:hypothetical protein [Virgibacillus ihumii]|uniref:hypothetical protein n=1 Tax=Virgibacillus ihumii TaxID=2686091 RepID=UPI00157BF35F|nr:hypothetical protein [Virgibacillus ihumii]
MDKKELSEMLSMLFEEKLQPMNERLEMLEFGQKMMSERFGKMESGQKVMNERFGKVESGQRAMNERLRKVESGQKTVIDKLDNVSTQVAKNTELLSSLEGMAGNVSEHDTDIKLLKKFVAKDWA